PVPVALFWSIRLARVATFGVIVYALTPGLRAQEHTHPADDSSVALQPLAQQVRRVETALAYLGQPLSADERNAIDGAIGMADTAAAVSSLQQILDRHVLATVHINPESRVKGEQ